MRVAGFVDATQHHGNGSVYLVFIMRELSVGRVEIGIGFAELKFIAFATDWDHTVVS